MLYSFSASLGVQVAGTAGGVMVVIGALLLRIRTQY
jgi:hypothetical protein